jgi:hypothetical protein
MKKSNYCMNLTFGGILNQHGHFKHTLRAQRCHDCGRWTLPCHTVPISHGSTAISEKKKSLAFLLGLYLYFPNIPRNNLIQFVWHARGKYTHNCRIFLYICQIVSEVSSALHTFSSVKW